MRNKRFIILTSFIVVAALTRLLPHPPNFAPIGALALFGGAYFNKKRYAFIVPMAAMLLADAFLGFHNTMLYVYGAFALVVGMGLWLKNNVSFGKVAGAAIGSSMLFFLITNFGVWLGSTFYAQNLTGLINCYVAAIPFYHYTLASDLLFSGILFGAFEWLKNYYPQLELSSVEA
jgi:hypothetical protein